MDEDSQPEEKSRSQVKRELRALKVLGMSVWEATLAWCMMGLGVALGAPRWGKLADHHGNRPVLITAVLEALLLACPFNQDTPHRFGSGGEEVTPVVPLLERRLIH